MRSTAGGHGNLLAISDLHIGYAENRALVEKMRPHTDDDWLLVAGDVSETVADIHWALETLSGRFRKVVWVPGNHELWTHPKDAVQLRGVARYEHLVAMCRELGVTTPKTPTPSGTGRAAPRSSYRSSCSTTTRSCRRAARPRTRAWRTPRGPG